MSFTHLHLHTEYSLLDGACRIEKLVSKAKQLNMTSLAITDHGVMYGAIDFYKACVQEGIKPIIGCEVYVAPNSRFEKTIASRNYYHMILLCKNNIGYQNLLQLVSRGFTEGFYSKPRIDDNLLEQYHEGLICLSACLAGEIPQKLLAGEYSVAKQKAEYYRDLFGNDSFYIELQNHGIREELEILPALNRIAQEIGVGVVATNDCHYIEKSDSQIHEILLCIQTGHTINDTDRMKFETDEFYLKSEAEMQTLFAQYDGAIENTQRIAQMCSVSFEFGVNKLPRFDLPNNENHLEYFRKNCYSGLTKHYGSNPDKSLIDRLEYEISTIAKMGFVDYYLIVNDFVQYAKSNDIPVGPGRGSGAGSLCAYCIGITDVDPIKHKLIFERFLNPERVSMPDFDIDFCTKRRKDVIDYVIRKYGESHVAQIISFDTMAAKAAIRDVGRALDMSYASVDEIVKLLPEDKNTVMPIEKSLGISTELKKRYDNDPLVRRLLDVAIALEGTPRHATTHAAGVVITDRPVVDYVPLAQNDKNIVTQYAKNNLEELGLLKMDFLGLRNLTVIDETEKIIKKYTNPSYSSDDIDDNDAKVFEMFAKGNTEGVFQFEGQAIRNVLVKLKPDCFEDVLAVVSLFRPGPMSSIPTYIDRRHNPSHIQYKHPLLKDILKDTYGCIVFQEQVMQIIQRLAGYSFGRADIVRRAMSKKKQSVMQKERNIFIHGLVDENGMVIVDGCVRRGVDEKIANSIFDEMESFASYAYNRAHAVSYALISYKTAWLKLHYSKEYMSALLSSVLGEKSKMARYIAECNRLKINVLPPNVNESDGDFTVSGSNIRYGLLAIKNLGSQLITQIISERRKKSYTSFYDFCKRNYGRYLNSKAVESLIKCGAFDGLGANRRQLLAGVKQILDNLEYDSRHNLNGQLSFFELGSTSAQASDEPSFPALEEFSKVELLHMEYEITGMYLSGHPMDDYSNFARLVRADSIGNITSKDNSYYFDGKTVTVVGVIQKVKTQLTKTNKMMAFVSIEDRFGSIEVVVFPNVYEQGALYLNDGNTVIMKGRLNYKENEDPKLLCDSVDKARTNDECKTIQQNIPEHNRPQQSFSDSPRSAPVSALYLRIDDLNTELFDRAKRVLDIFDGPTPVIFYLTKSNRKIKAPSSMWVDINDVMIKELKFQLGAENVVAK